LSFVCQHDVTRLPCLAVAYRDNAGIGIEIRNVHGRQFGVARIRTGLCRNRTGLCRRYRRKGMPTPKPALAEERLKTKVGKLLEPGHNDPWWEVRDTLNGPLRGGRITSPMGRVGRPSATSIAMSMSACAISSPDGSRWQGAGQNGSPATSCMGNADYCASNACL